MPLPASAFQPAETVVERDVVLGDGTPHPVFFRILPNSTFERYAMMKSSDDEEVAATAPSWLVAQGICEADGTLSLSVAQAERLKRDVLLRLANKLLEINSFAPPPKAVPEGPLPNGSAPEAPTSGSGTNLPLQ